MFVNNHQAKVLFFFTQIVRFITLSLNLPPLLVVRPRYSEKYIATIFCTWEWASSSFYSITLNIYQTNFNILTLEFFWKNIKPIWYLGLMLKPMCVNKVWLWSKGWHNEKEGGWEEEEKENEGFCSSRRRSFGTHWFDLIWLSSPSFGVVV